MNKTILLSLLLLTLALATACKSTPSGSREFIPGKGWVPA